MPLSCEADTGPDKAHTFSWEGKEREGAPLAHAMGLRAASSGEGRHDAWLKEKEMLRQHKEEKGRHRRIRFAPTREPNAPTPML